MRLMARVLIFNNTKKTSKVNSLFIYQIWEGISVFLFIFKFTHSRCKGTHQQKLMLDETSALYISRLYFFEYK